MSRDYRKEAFTSEIGYEIVHLIRNRHKAKNLDIEDYADADRGLYPSAINKEVDAAYSTVRNYIAGLKELGILKEGEKVGRKRFYEFDLAGARDLWVAIMLHYSDLLLTNKKVVTRESREDYPIEKVKGLLPESKLPSYKYGDLDDLTVELKDESALKLVMFYEEKRGGIATFLDLWIDIYIDNISDSTLEDMFINDMWSSMQSRRRFLERIDSSDKEEIIRNAEVEKNILVEEIWQDDYDIDSAIDELKKNAFPEKLKPVYEILELINGESKSFVFDAALGSVWRSTLMEEYDIKSGFEIESEWGESKKEGNQLTEDMVEDMYRYLSTKEEDPAKELRKIIDMRDDLGEDEKENFKNKVEKMNISN